MNEQACNKPWVCFDAIEPDLGINPELQEFLQESNFILNNFYGCGILKLTTPNYARFAKDFKLDVKSFVESANLARDKFIIRQISKPTKGKPWDLTRPSQLALLSFAAIREGKLASNDTPLESTSCVEDPIQNDVLRTRAALGQSCLRLYLHDPILKVKIRGKKLNNNCENLKHHTQISETNDKVKVPTITSIDGIAIGEVISAWLDKRPPNNRIRGVDMAYILDPETREDYSCYSLDSIKRFIDQLKSNIPAYSEHSKKPPESIQLFIRYLINRQIQRKASTESGTLITYAQRNSNLSDYTLLSGLEAINREWITIPEDIKPATFLEFVDQLILPDLQSALETAKLRQNQLEFWQVSSSAMRRKKLEVKLKNPLSKIS